MTEIIEPFILQIEADQEDISIVDWLANHCSLSKNILKDCMTKGAVWLHRMNTSQKTISPIRRGNKRLHSGDTLYLYYNPNVLNKTPPTPLLVEDKEGYSAWYKPYGMLSHGSKWGDHCSITRWIEQHHQPQRACFLVHRLDRAACGIILVAHNKKIAADLCEQFEKRQTRKRYHAIVSGQLPQSTMSLTQPLDGKTAHTDVSLLKYDSENHTSLIDITLHTGRKHQIRRHLTEQGFPLVGDRLYNPQFAPAAILDKDPLTPIANLQLRAYLLGFKCPISHKNQLVTLNKDIFISTPKILYKK